MISLGYRQRLALTYLLIAVVSLSVIAVYMTRATRGYLLAHVDDELRANAELAAEAFRPSLLESASRQRDALSGIDRLADSIGRRTGLRMTVIAPDGAVLGDSQADPASMENHGRRPEILEAARSGLGLATRGSNSLGVQQRYIAIPINTADGELLGYVRVAMSLSQVEASSAAVRRFALSAAAVAVIAGLALSLWLSASIGRPLNDLATAAREIARGRFGRRLPEKGAVELRELAASFNFMADELERNTGELVDRKNRMETILLAMTDGVVAVDSSHRVILVNRAACEILGIPERSAVGRHVLEASRNRDLAEALEAGAAGQHDVREIRLASPGPRCVRVHAAPIRQASSAHGGAVAVLQDISDLRRLERVRRDFVSNVSHELRTPITSIKGSVDTLLDGAMDDPEALPRFLGIIAQETDRLARIVADLLELSRLESSGEVPSATPVSLRAAVDAAVQVVACRADAKGIHVSLGIPEDLPELAADESLVCQVLINLLDNAVNYTPDGGEISVNASCETRERVRVDVSDTGLGIAPEHLPRVFERFYRVDKARSRQAGGTGLGLAIVKHIVERYGGCVSVESRLGEGSTFSFVLPTWDVASHAG
jgi:two-component system phosphate regulon sensor histidine kinase PhoR